MELSISAQNAGVLCQVIDNIIHKHDGMNVVLFDNIIGRMIDLLIIKDTNVMKKLLHLHFLQFQKIPCSAVIGFISRFIDKDKTGQVGELICETQDWWNICVKYTAKIDQIPSVMNNFQSSLFNQVLKILTQLCVEPSKKFKFEVFENIDLKKIAKVTILGVFELMRKGNITANNLQFTFEPQHNIQINIPQSIQQLIISFIEPKYDHVLIKKKKDFQKEEETNIVNKLIKLQLMEQIQNSVAYYHNSDTRVEEFMLELYKIDHEGILV